MQDELLYYYTMKEISHQENFAENMEEVYEGKVFDFNCLYEHIDGGSNNLGLEKKVSRIRKGLKTTFKTLEQFFILSAIVILPSLIKPNTNLEEKESSFEEMKKRAKTELNTKGITSEQEGSLRLINGILFKEITPLGYGSAYNVREIPKRIIFGRDKMSDAKEDAWKMYLGMPQVYNSFAISDYKPTKSSENTYYYKIRNFTFPDYVAHTPNKDETKLIRVENLHDVIQELQKDPNKTLFVGDDTQDVMGIFKISLGEDERGTYISYYDEWDLNVFPESGGGFLGRAFEIYDRIYYDKETFKPVDKEFQNMFDYPLEKSI